jgi:polyketide cyclase/dehydrase/lipid transport protein
MKSTVTVEINLPQARVAELFSNPRHTNRWMHDVDRVEVVSGELGAPGSQYRLVPKKGNMVVLSVTGTFQSLSATKTLLVSSEMFSFTGAIPAILGFLAQGAIRKAHRRHMEAFKAFAETQHAGVSA